jgi:hypothetical protein
MWTLKKLGILAASPSDLATERAKVEPAAATLKPLAKRLDILVDGVDGRGRPRYGSIR